MKSNLFVLTALILSSLSVVAANDATQNVKCGDVITLTATPTAGYKFRQWQDGNTDNPRTVTISATTNIWEYQATFEAASYTITILVKEGTEGEGTVEQAIMGGNYNEVIHPVATPIDQCSAFDHWENAEGRNIGSTATLDYTITEDATIYAVFKKAEFTVTAGGDNGSVAITLQ